MVQLRITDAAGTVLREASHPREALTCLDRVWGLGTGSGFRRRRAPTWRFGWTPPCWRERCSCPKGS